MEAAQPAGALAPGAYADSVDSLSPRSRGGESWDEPLPAPSGGSGGGGGNSKLRLMCSYGGHIVPRPHDKALCYLGGETRIMAVDRHSSLADIHSRLSRSLLGGRPFSLKYQLPSEDLDSLISVATDEDLENMIEEYDRVASSGAGGAKNSRLRLFLFPAKGDSSTGVPSPASSSIVAGGSLLDDSSKSETWFVDALNGAMPLLARNHSSADSAASSVNCLLGLEDSYPSPNAAAGGGPTESESGQVLFPRRDSSGKLAGGGRHGAQDVQSMPDSPMLETTSSFGSASSAPFLSSLPPIRVRQEEERGSDPRMAVDAASVEEQFAQMNISGQQQKPPLDVEGFKHHLQHFPPPPLHSINPIALSAEEASRETSTTVSPTDNPNPGPLISSNSDDVSHQGGIRRSPPQQAQQQQQPQQQLPDRQVLDDHKFLDVSLSGDAISGPLYYQERPSNASDPQQQETHFTDPSYRFPVHVTDQGYVLHRPSMQPPPMRTVEQFQQQQPLQQQTQQQQSAISHPATAHHPSGTVLPIPSYYNHLLIHPQQQLPQVATHPYRPQVPLYFLPIHHGSAYNLPVQPKLGDSVATALVPSTSMPTIPPPSYVHPSHVAPAHKQELPTNVYRTGLSSTPGFSQPPQPTKLIHLDQSSQYVGYQPLHHPSSQTTASRPAASGYGYEYVDAVHAYQMYYTPASSAALAPQYQMMNAGSVTAEPPLGLQQQPDAKQTSSS